MNTFVDAAGAPFRQCYLCNETKPDDWDHWHNYFSERTKHSCTQCNGELPPLQRDLQNPMALLATKPCKRCGVEKPNDFDHFGRKLWRGRDETTTVDVCNGCRRKSGPRPL